MTKEHTKKWKKLDNAGKLYSSVARKGNAKVFRFSCQLYENIKEADLQSALESTLIQFPGYQYVLKRGLFWCYLESSKVVPRVKLESQPPCSQFYYGESRSPLFQLTYYKKRINLEIFHVLSDGTGALQFLKVLVCYYLKIQHPVEFSDTDPLFDYNATEKQQLDDSFAKYYSGKFSKRRNSKNSSANTTNAYQFHGQRVPEGNIKIIEGSIPTKGLLVQAKAYHTTITGLLTAILIEAFHNDMSKLQERKPVVIGIPVNLRNYFKSESMRNFFGMIFTSYNFSNSSENFEDIVSYVDSSLKEQLTQEHLSKRINSLNALERNIILQILPLPTKELTLLIANSISSRGISASLSNIGIITMPEELSPYIDRFDVFFPTDKFHIALCSYKEHINISIASPFMDTEIQKDFFRKLQKMGLEIAITSNNLTNTPNATQRRLQKRIAKEKVVSE